MLNKKTTININKNGFKPFFSKSHLKLSAYYRYTYNDFEAEKRLKKDVLYATEPILKKGLIKNTPISKSKPNSL